MEEKLLFASKGWSRGRQTLYGFLGFFFLLFGFLTILPVLDKSSNSNPWHYIDKPEATEWLFPILLLLAGIYMFSALIISAQSYLRIYENHIEAKSANFVRMFLTGGSSSSNIILTFDEIQGASSRQGQLDIETYNGHKSVFCSDPATAERLIIDILRFRRANNYPNYPQNHY